MEAVVALELRNVLKRENKILTDQTKQTEELH